MLTQKQASVLQRRFGLDLTGIKTRPGKSATTAPKTSAKTGAKKGPKRPRTPAQIAATKRMLEAAAKKRKSRSAAAKKVATAAKRGKAKRMLRK